MDHDRFNPGLEEVERALLYSKPAPPPDFVSRLEARLLPAQRRAPRRALRFRLATVGAVAAASACVPALSLAGVGPLTLDSDDGTRADDPCREVPTVKRESVPLVGTDREGRPRIMEREREIRRSVKRCP